MILAEVGVDLCSDHACVSKPLRDRKEGYSGHERLGGEGMPQLVQFKPGQFGVLDYPLENAPVICDIEAETGGLA